MSDKSTEKNITPGDLVEYCLDPRYPPLKKTSDSDKLETKMNIKVGIVLSAPDKHGYIKIQPTPLPDKGKGDGLEVHVEFCRVLSR